MRISISTLVAREAKQGENIVTVTFTVSDIEQLQFIINNLSKIPGVESVLFGRLHRPFGVHPPFGIVGIIERIDDILAVLLVDRNSTSSRQLDMEACCFPKSCRGSRMILPGPAPSG